MIHGFNDNTKEKVEMYAKGDFVLIEGSVTVSSEDFKNVTFTAAELLSEYGIDDITDYLPISVFQTDKGGIVKGYTTSHVYGQNGPIAYPAVEYTDGAISTDLTIMLRNSISVGQTINYKVLLLKIS